MMGRMIALWLGMMLCMMKVSAQLHIVSRVVDVKTGEPLPFASIYINGDRNTISNEEGEFVIDADSTDVLRITYVGYRKMMVSANEVGDRICLSTEGYALGEVEVFGADYIITKVMKRIKKEYKEHKWEEANFFYRQTSRAGLTSTSFLEAFFVARPAIQLRKLSFAKGRFVTVAGALTVNPINYFTFAEVPISSVPIVSLSDELVPLDDNYQNYYHAECQTITDGERRVFVVSFVPKKSARKAIEARVYVDGKTFQLLKYEGKGLKDAVRNEYQGGAHIVPIDYSFVVNCQLDHGFTEVQSVHFNVHYTDKGKYFETTGILYNVAERYVEGKHKMKFYDNLIEVIKQQDYDSEFWRKNEIVKRTPMEEEAINLFERDNLFGIY
ncbi:MAG: carboxypeptidase-like regulatory domain-containing protein [Prevotella sp.]|nr:carboxypeptidase-like regulatory domain-containing protein [Prevotella sp.]